MLAFAGDTALYQKAIGLLQSNYLYAERLDQQKMFVEAGQQLEAQIEWLLVTEQPGALVLHDSLGWTVTVPYQSELPQSLSALEDAVLSAKHPIDKDLDLRVEILKGVVRPLDRHTVVLAGDSLERFDERISGTLSGVGATIGPDPQGNLVVKGLFPGSPAEKGGLQIGDFIRQVDGVSTTGMTTSDATARIRGEAGTTVKLTVSRQAANQNESQPLILELTLARAELSIPNVESRVTPEGLGLVKIDHFSEKTSTYLSSSLRSLGDALLSKGLAIDLRGNTGGSLIQSALAADVFINSGLLVTTRGRGGQSVPGLVPEILARPEPTDQVGPMVVLIDPNTASGSEILAGALAEASRALLIGEPSFGKGTVQKTYLIGPSIKLKMTVAEYRLDHDRVVADVGLAPDLLVSPFVIEENRVWYADPQRLIDRVPAQIPSLPWVKDDNDFLTYIAAKLIQGAANNTRAAMLASLQALLPELSKEADEKLVSALKKVGIDWSGGASAAPSLGVVLVSGKVRAGEEGKVVFEVQNRGAELARVGLRLHGVHALWDGEVLVIGKLKAGEVRRVELPVQPARGPARVDPVAMVLEQDGRLGATIWTGELVTEASAPFNPSVSAVWQDCAPCNAGEVPGVLLSLRSDQSLEDIWVKFEFPEQPGIELLQERSEAFDLHARKTTQVFMGVRTGEQFVGSLLPLTLVVGDASGRTLKKLELPILMGEGPVSRAAPVIALETPLRQAAGMMNLEIRATDDRKIDHILVFAGTERLDPSRKTPSVIYEGDKIAWQDGGEKKMSFSTSVPVIAGVNRYTILAEDDQGLVTSEVRYVLGE